jgi:hypothetical protein
MLIKLTGTTHAKGLTGTLLIKLLTPQFQAILIDSAQTLQLQADIAMQRFASLQPIVPPALKIYGPHLVGFLGLSAAAQPPALTRQAHLAFLTQTTAFQHPLQTAFAGRFSVLAIGTIRGSCAGPNWDALASVRQSGTAPPLLGSQDGSATAAIRLPFH